MKFLKHLFGFLLWLALIANAGICLLVVEAAARGGGYTVAAWAGLQAVTSLATAIVVADKWAQ